MGGLDALLLLTPFLETGFSYYLSVPTLGVIGMLTICGKSVPLLFKDYLAMRLMVVVFMISSTIAYQDVDAQDILRALREATVFFLITGCTEWHLSTVSTNMGRSALRTITIIAVCMFVLVSVQAFYFLRGVYFGLPFEVFIQNAGTLPSELSLRYSDIRPMGTFGEPSYLGGVCLSLLFAVSPWLQRKSGNKLVAFLLLAIVVVSRTVSGIVSLVIYGVYFFGRSQKKAWMLYVGAFAGIVLTIAVLGVVTDRLAKIQSGKDESTMSRVVLPLKIAPFLLTDTPLGTPLLHFVDIGYISLAGSAGEEVTHNSLFNLVIEFGWFGFFAIFVLLVSIKEPNIRMYVLLISFQNGGLLGIDKFFLISLSAVTYHMFRISSKEESEILVQASDGHAAA